MAQVVTQMITLYIDAVTARLLHDYLWSLGEEIAAGAPRPVLSTNDAERLGQVMWDLRNALGLAQPYGQARPSSRADK